MRQRRLRGLAQGRCQQAHLAALERRGRYPEIAFASSEKLSLALVRGKLHELSPSRTISMRVTDE